MTTPAETGRSIRRCACGCGASLSGMRADAKYASPACRARAANRRSADLPAFFDPAAFWGGYWRCTRTQPAIRGA
jgi:hypothetical protein